VASEAALLVPHRELKHCGCSRQDLVGRLRRSAVLLSLLREALDVQAKATDAVRFMEQVVVERGAPGLQS